MEASRKENNDDDENLFVEIKREDPNPLPQLIPVYVARVEPSRCRGLLKQLAHDMPLGSNTDHEGKLYDLSHLKRVQKQKSTINKEESPCPKKQKKEDGPPLLEILLRDVDSLEGKLGAKLFGKEPPNSSPTTTTEFLQTKYNVTTIVQRMVPGRPPESHQEWQEFQNLYWPTIFFPQRSKEYLDQQLQLTHPEIQQMKFGMEQAIQDKSSFPGAIILDPSTGTVVARSTDERRLQTTTHPNNNSSNNNNTNPLSTSILFAIQGVSRLEREKAIATAGMNSTEFQKGQYLCTGYDLYTTLEPTVFEAMSLVHSRIRRVVFGQGSDTAGGIRSLQIHALPSTNHHYRAFQCKDGSAFNTQCADASAHGNSSYDK